MMWRTMMSFIRLAAAVLLLTVGTSLVNPPMARADTDCHPRLDFGCLAGGEGHEDYLCDQPNQPDCWSCIKQPGVCNGDSLGSMEGYKTYDS